MADSRKNKANADKRYEFIQPGTYIKDADMRLREDLVFFVPLAYKALEGFGRLPIKDNVFDGLEKERRTIIDAARALYVVYAEKQKDFEYNAGGQGDRLATEAAIESENSIRQTASAESRAMENISGDGIESGSDNLGPEEGLDSGMDGTEVAIEMQNDSDDEEIAAAKGRKVTSDRADVYGFTSEAHSIFADYTRDVIKELTRAADNPEGTDIFTSADTPSSEFRYGKLDKDNPIIRRPADLSDLVLHLQVLRDSMNGLLGGLDYRTGSRKDRMDNPAISTAIDRIVEACGKAMKDNPYPEISRYFDSIMGAHSRGYISGKPFRDSKTGKLLDESAMYKILKDDPKQFMETIGYISSMMVSGAERMERDGRKGASPIVPENDDYRFIANMMESLASAYRSGELKRLSDEAIAQNRKMTDALGMEEGLHYIGQATPYDIRRYRDAYSGRIEETLRGITEDKESREAFEDYREKSSYHQNLRRACFESESAGEGYIDIRTALEKLFDKDIVSRLDFQDPLESTGEGFYAAEKEYLALEKHLHLVKASLFDDPLTESEEKLHSDMLSSIEAGEKRLEESRSKLMRYFNNIPDKAVGTAFREAFVRNAYELADFLIADQVFEKDGSIRTAKNSIASWYLNEGSAVIREKKADALRIAFADPENHPDEISAYLQKEADEFMKRSGGNFLDDLERYKRSLMKNVNEDENVRSELYRRAASIALSDWRKDPMSPEEEKKRIASESAYFRFLVSEPGKISQDLMEYAIRIEKDKWNRLPAEGRIPLEQHLDAFRNLISSGKLREQAGNPEKGGDLSRLMDEYRTVWNRRRERGQLKVISAAFEDIPSDEIWKNEYILKAAKSISNEYAEKRNADAVARCNAHLDEIRSSIDQEKTDPSAIAARVGNALSEYGKSGFKRLNECKAAGGDWIELGQQMIEEAIKDGIFAPKMQEAMEYSEKNFGLIRSILMDDMDASWLVPEIENSKEYQDALEYVSRKAEEAHAILADPTSPSSAIEEISGVSDPETIQLLRDGMAELSFHHPIKPIRLEDGRICEGQISMKASSGFVSSPGTSAKLTGYLSIAGKALEESLKNVQKANKAYCIKRAEEQAEKLGLTLNDETRRLISHSYDVRFAADKFSRSSRSLSATLASLGRFTAEPDMQASESGRTSNPDNMYHAVSISGVAEYATQLAGVTIGKEASALARGDIDVFSIKDAVISSIKANAEGKADSLEAAIRETEKRLEEARTLASAAYDPYMQYEICEKISEFAVRLDNAAKEEERIHAQRMSGKISSELDSRLSSSISRMNEFLASQLGGYVKEFHANNPKADATIPELMLSRLEKVQRRDFLDITEDERKVTSDDLRKWAAEAAPLGRSAKELQMRDPSAGMKAITDAGVPEQEEIVSRQKAYLERLERHLSQQKSLKKMLLSDGFAEGIAAVSSIQPAVFSSKDLENLPVMQEKDAARMIAENSQKMDELFEAAEKSAADAASIRMAAASLERAFEAAHEIADTYTKATEEISTDDSRDKTFNALKEYISESGKKPLSAQIDSYLQSPLASRPEFKGLTEAVKSDRNLIEADIRRSWATQMKGHDGKRYASFVPLVLRTFETIPIASTKDKLMNTSSFRGGSQLASIADDDRIRYDITENAVITEHRNAFSSMYPLVKPKTRNNDSSEAAKRDMKKLSSEYIDTQYGFINMVPSVGIPRDSSVICVGLEGGRTGASKPDFADILAIASSQFLSKAEKSADPDYASRFREYAASCRPENFSEITTDSSRKNTDGGFMIYQVDDGTPPGFAVELSKLRIYTSEMGGISIRASEPRLFDETAATGRSIEAASIKSKAEFRNTVESYMKHGAAVESIRQTRKKNVNVVKGKGARD